MTTKAAARMQCVCGTKLGEWVDDTLFVTRVGLILRGGKHDWVCRCGRTNEIDLETGMLRDKACCARR